NDQCVCAPAGTAVTLRAGARRWAARLAARFRGTPRAGFARLRAGSSVACSETLARVSAATPIRISLLNPTSRPSTAPPTKAAAGSIQLRASMMSTPLSRSARKRTGKRAGSDAKRGRTNERRSEPTADEEPGHCGNHYRAEHLLARAVAHQAGGIVNRMLGRLGGGRGRIVAADVGASRLGPGWTEKRQGQKREAEHQSGAADNAERRQRAVKELQPLVQRRDAEPERQQDQDGAEKREHDGHHGAADLALDVDPDQPEHLAQHQRRPRISPMTMPTHRAPATTASGLRRAMRSNSPTMGPAWSR